MRGGHPTVRRLSMSVIFDNNKLLSNLKRQSLRLSKHLEIPQNQAQILLAKHFYNENSFAEIRRKINSKNYGCRIFFAAVAPDADKETLTKFVEALPLLLVDLASSPISQLVTTPPKQLILNVFSLNHSTILDND